MITDKQVKVLSILDTGRYKEVDGLIYSFKKGVWKELRPNKLPTGYYQVSIFNGIRNGKGLKAVVYVHQLVYLIHNGLYPNKYEIDHIDRNRTNNNISNLRAVNTAMNAANKESKRESFTIKTIRSEEIKQIKELVDLGMNQSAIARQLGLNRLSVRYTINKINAGLNLKYE